MTLAKFVKFANKNPLQSLRVTPAYLRTKCNLYRIEGLYVRNKKIKVVLK